MIGTVTNHSAVLGTRRSAVERVTAILPGSIFLAGETARGHAAHPPADPPDSMPQPVPVSTAILHSSRSDRPRKHENHGHQ